MCPASPTRVDLDSNDLNQLRSALRDIAEDVRKKAINGPYVRDIEVLKHLYGEEKCKTLGIYQIPDGFVLSVVIPAYNEVETIESILASVRNTGLPVEMIVVDDGSTDGTRELLQDLKRRKREHFELVLHETNQGKGAAVRTGLLHATGNVVVIQDADLEYDPEDFHLLLQPILENEADVVYGSRFLADDRSISPAWHRRGNKLLTYLSNQRSASPPHRRGDVLQDVSPGVGPAGRPDVAREGIRLRTRDHRQVCAVAERAIRRTPHSLRATFLFRGEEDRLEGRDLGVLVHRPLLSAGE